MALPATSPQVASTEAIKSHFQVKNTYSVSGIYSYTCMVSHRGTVVSFGLDRDRKIKYVALDLAGENNQEVDEETKDIDATFWSDMQELNFPKELSQSGFAVVKNYQMPIRYKVSEEVDQFNSSTARLTAKAPFQVLSDGKYIYLFRQALPSSSDLVDSINGHPIVDSTVLVDRFVLSGKTLRLSKEIRYQRSQHKTQPASRKDTLSPVNMEKVPFYEPTRELAFVSKLSANGGGFSVLQIPTQETEVKRWQLFFYDTVNHKIRSISVKTNSDGWFDPRDGEEFIKNFRKEKGLDFSFLKNIHEQIVLQKTDQEIAVELKTLYATQLASLTPDEMEEVVFAVRTGIVVDDFTIAGYQVETGMSSIFYYQQEMDSFTGKPMKSKASVMLTMGLSETNPTLPAADQKYYLGVVNFAVSNEGRLSRLSSENLQLQELDMEGMDKETVLTAITGMEDEKVRLMKKVEELRQKYLQDFSDSLDSPPLQNQLKWYDKPYTASPIVRSMISDYLEDEVVVNAHTTNLNVANTAISNTATRILGYQGGLNELNSWEASERLKTHPENATIGPKVLDFDGQHFYVEYKNLSKLENNGNYFYKTNYSENFDAVSLFKYPQSGRDTMKIYVFKDENVWLCTLNQDLSSYNYSKFKLDPEYPKYIQEIWSEVPSNIDTCFLSSRGRRYFLKGNEYWCYGYSNSNILFKHGSISRDFGGLPSNINAVVRKTDGTFGGFYFFKGTQVWNVELKETGSGFTFTIDRGYPKPIQTEFMGHFPDAMDSIDAAFLRPYYWGSETESYRRFCFFKGSESFHLRKRRNSNWTPVYDYSNSWGTGITGLFQGYLSAKKAKAVASWSNGDAKSKNRANCYTHYYSFTIYQDTRVKIEVEATGAVPYLFLLKGETKLIENGQQNSFSASLDRTLNAATYLIEVTTIIPNQTGSFTLRISEEIYSFTEVEYSAFYLENIHDDRPVLQKLLEKETHTILPFYKDLILPELQILSDLQTNLAEKQKELNTGISSVPMPIIEIDENGLASSGGLLKFAYTADQPFLFDDSLGRVSLFFRGKNENFFAAYFNPTISQEQNVSPSESDLYLTPRLSIDMEVVVVGEVINNAGQLSISDQDKIVEKWEALPQSAQKVADVLNGKGHFTLGYLTEDYKKSSGILSIACQADNEFIPTSELSGLTNLEGLEIPMPDYFKKNRQLLVGDKNFAIKAATENPILLIKAGQLMKKSLGSLVRNIAHIDTVWELLIDKEIIQASAPEGEAVIASTDIVVSKNGDQAEVKLDWPAKEQKAFEKRIKLLVLAPEHIKTILDLVTENGMVEESDESTKEIKDYSDQLTLATDQEVSIQLKLRESDKVKWINSIETLVKKGAFAERIWDLLIEKEVFQNIIPPEKETRIYIDELVFTNTEEYIEEVLFTPADKIKAKLDLSVSDEIKYLEDKLVELIRSTAARRTISFEVEDRNSQAVDLLATGLTVQTQYDYSNFTCTPNNLTEVTIEKWQHESSFLFTANAAAQSMLPNFTRTYTVQNAIGQWEAYDPGQAISFDRALEVEDGAGKVGLITTTEKLNSLAPSTNGLTMEAWINPRDFGAEGEEGTVLYYKNGGQNYGLGIAKADKQYQCFALIGGEQIVTKEPFEFGQWRHLAFTYKKYWGLGLNNNTSVNCGHDLSLNLEGEFSIELLVKYNVTRGAATLLVKQGEYSVQIKNNKVILSLGNSSKNLLSSSSLTITPDKFQKITIIRSKAKLQSSSAFDQPSQSNGNGSNPLLNDYENMETKELLASMARKQDVMEEKMEISQSNMMGITGQEKRENDNKYFYSLFIGDQNDGHQEHDISPATSSFSDLLIGNNSFNGTLGEIRMWNRALSTEEAIQNVISEDKNSLLSWWPINEGEGKFLYDAAGKNHGVIKTRALQWVESPDPTLPKYKFYVDGKKTTVNTVDKTVAAANQFSFGGYKDAAGKKEAAYDGLLEEVRIWGVARSAEEISDNVFGRLKGEREKLLANFTFDTDFFAIYQGEEVAPVLPRIRDLSYNSIILHVEGWSGELGKENISQVLSTAPISAEIPAVRSALAGVKTDYHDNISACPAVVEYGDIQKNEDGTFNGILKRCYAFIKDGQWQLVTGYKVGNLITEWYGQAQFKPQVMGFLEGAPPVPGENFPIGKDGDVDTYAYKLNNSIEFQQAEEVNYNFSTSKESGYQVAVENELVGGLGFSTLLAPLGFGIAVQGVGASHSKSNWETTGKRSQSFERGVSVNTDRAMSATLAGYDNGKTGKERYYKMGNTGYALVKSKTADIFLLRLAHNNALVGISWQPNPDIPEDTNIISFPINPFYIKQGVLDGKSGDKADVHYPLAQAAYGEYSYFKPKEAYQLKNRIEKEQQELKNYYEDGFDPSKTNDHFTTAAAATGAFQAKGLTYGLGPIYTSLFNQTMGQVATQLAYNNSKVKDDLSKVASQRNLANTYVWTMEGGFYAESTQIAETYQEVYNNEISLSLSGGLGIQSKMEGVIELEQKFLATTGSNLTMTKSRTKESSQSFGLNVSVDVPTSPRYKYDDEGINMQKIAITPGTVDAYRFMSFYLESKPENYLDLFTKVIDPKWLEESPDPNANALREARSDEKKPFCWRILHRVTFVSRILPEFEPEAAPSLEKLMRVKNIESNFMLVKLFEPYVKHLRNPEDFFYEVDRIIGLKLPEFAEFTEEIKKYLGLYFGVGE